MKKIINNPADFVDEVMEGIEAAYGDRLAFYRNDRRVLVSTMPVREGKVGVMTAGGSGHLPVFLGYVGSGMLDACAVGNVFASPACTKMTQAIRASDRGSGVLCVIGNYGGDRMNLEQAMQDAEWDGIRTKAVYVTDDLASAPPELAPRRRGVAGLLYAFKIAGAAAAQGMDLNGTAAVTQKAVDAMRTIGVALSPCILPEVGVPTFSVGEQELELGMGIHGEKGIETRPMMRADDLADLLLERIDEELHLTERDEVSVLVNGLGATPLEEQLIVYRRLKARLDEKKVHVIQPHIGEFATSMEMAGLSVTVIRLDAQLRELLEAPASTPFYTNCNK